MLTQAPRGTNDIYGDYMLRWQKLESIVRDLCKDFNFNEIRTPVFEHSELFNRVGETTDIVQKEMYTFEDKGGRSITLKPEGTAGVVRAFIERNIFADIQPTKLYYITPAFRYEKPQAGRLRQFHQFGIEVFGSDSSSADAEVISLGYQMLKRLGITNVSLHINSLGGQECRSNYNKLLKDYFVSHQEELCPTCQDRLQKNPLRILDCKNASCKVVIKDAPLMLDHLGPECKAAFDELQELLTAMSIPYEIDPWIVRGLDYYTRTVFEFISGEIGAQGTVCGGGRYNGLIEECGGRSTPAVGFGAGIERLLMTMEASGNGTVVPDPIELYIGSMGEDARRKAFALCNSLRSNGISCEIDLLERGVKAQMKYANKLGAQYTIILGDNELSTGTANVKNMETGEQVAVNLDQIIDYMKNV